MKKRILSIVLFLSICVSWLPSTAYAVDGDAFVAEVWENAQQDGESEKYSTIEEAIESINGTDAYIRLLQDISVELTWDKNSGTYYGLRLNVEKDILILDLGGHTLTGVWPNDIDASVDSGAFCAVVSVSGNSDCQSLITNGTIVLSNAHVDENPGVIIWNFAVVGEDFPNMKLDSVEIRQDDFCQNASILAAVSNIPRGNGYFHYTLENCVIKLGSTVPAAISLLAAMHENTAEIASIISGDYECLTAPSGIKNIIKYKQENAVRVDGVTTTVIVSDATTAMIVENGNAYLYDTLQEAVNDAARRQSGKAPVKISLVKAPAENDKEITIPDDAPAFAVAALTEGEGAPSTDGITYKTESGTSVTPGEDGTVQVVKVTGVTLDKETLSLTQGTKATLTATVAPNNATDKTVTWVSSATDVATVDANGKVTAVSAGEATITVTTVDGNFTATCTVTVSREPNIPDPNGITVTQPANGTIKVNPSNGSAGTLITVTATPDEGYELAYITVDGERITGNTFRMPDKAVTVSAVFVPVTFPFVDVNTSDWFYDYVAYVYSNGLMDGTSATTFEPNANMTRAMVWAILARIDGETVTGANWIDTARAWAMAEGVSDGTDPNGLVTREQFATMLYRYAVAKGYDVSIGESTNILSYADYDEISEWAIPAMQWACGSGVITGVTESTLVPQGTATRAQCAAMLMRFMEL